jgi:hypothetical protein
MQQKMTQRLTVIFGAVMAAILALSAILPVISPQQTVPPARPTNTPRPTDVPPVADYESIVFDQEDYLHPSGLFAIPVPEGWDPTAPVNTGVQAQASLNNPNSASVIEVYVEDAGGITTLDQLSARFDTNTLDQSWNEYDEWTELGGQAGRRFDETSQRMFIDFALSEAGQQYLARQATWTDTQWIYVVRVVAPEGNQAAFFDFMLENIISRIRANTQFQGTPIGWTGYYDRTWNHIIRFPQGWTLSDGGAGRPASLESFAGGTLRVEQRPQAVDSEDAAREFVMSQRPSAEILSVTPITRGEAEGFQVAYSYTDPDGAGRSGLTVLINDGNGQVHVADGTVAGGAVDLITEDGRAQYFEVTTALDTFSLLSGFALPEEEPLPTQTPFPTIARTPQPGVLDVLGELTAPAESEITPEGEATPAADATAEATAEE